MVLTPSMMTRLGVGAPDFKLKDVTSGKEYTLASFAGKKALLVMFICKHCPYVKHVQGELARLGRDYTSKGVGIVAISSNDAVSHPEDAPESLAGQAKDQAFLFPYLFDADQSVAKAYAAACTPDFFVFDAERRLAYRGQLDESRPENGKPVTGADLRAAVDVLLAGGTVSEKQRPSIGCNIKWKKGAEPAYFGNK